MSDTTELEQLKQEVAALRKQVHSQQQSLDDLKQFLSIQKPKDGPAYLHVKCWGIDVVHPDQPNRTQAMLMSSERGPYLSLWGSDQKARLILKVENDAACVQLLTGDLKQAAFLTVDEPGGCGQVAVLEKGSPRAVMKAIPQDGGVVSVVHEGGQARAFMSSTEHNGGELTALTADMRVGVKVTGSAPTGGTVSVHRLNGKPAVILACTDQFGAVMVNDAKGQLLASLPQT